MFSNKQCVSTQSQRLAKRTLIYFVLQRNYWVVFKLYSIYCNFKKNCVNGTKSLHTYILHLDINLMTLTIEKDLAGPKARLTLVECFPEERRGCGSPWSRQEQEWLFHIRDWKWEMAQLSQFLGLGMGIKNIIPKFWDWQWEWKIKFPTFGIGNGNENIIPNIWELEIEYHFQKSWECNWEL